MSSDLIQPSTSVILFLYPCSLLRIVLLLLYKLVVCLRRKRLRLGVEWCHEILGFSFTGLRG